MKQFSFNKDTVLLIDGVRYIIVRTIMPQDEPDTFENRTVCFETDSGLFHQHTIKDLLKLYAESRLKLDGAATYISPEIGVEEIEHRALSTLTDKAMAAAIRRKDYVLEILKQGKWNSNPILLEERIRKAAIILGDIKPPSPASVYRWYRRLETNLNELRCLIDRNDKKGNRTQRIAKEAIEIVEEVLSSHYLNQQRLSVKEVSYIIRHEVNLYNKANSQRQINTPSLSFLYGLVRKIPEFDRVAKRHGRNHAINSFTAGREAPQPEFILQIAEVDHSPLDIEVVDDEAMLPMGRPVVTIILDGYSRMPLGMFVSFAAASIQAVSGCLENAILPKTYVKELYPEVNGDWPAYGRVANLVCDNGGEFHSLELEKICLNLGIMLQYCPTRIPFFKGKIERYLKSLNYELIHALPGTTFSNYIECGDYKTEKSATITFRTLMAILHKWIIDIYIVDNHDGIDDTPLNRWNEGVKKSPPSLPGDITLLKQMVSRLTRRKVSSEGVVIEKVAYNNDALQKIRFQHGNGLSVNVRYRDHDMTRVYVDHPDTHELIEVMAVDQNYVSGLTHAQHQMILRLAGQRRKQRVDMDSICAAKAEIREIVANDQMSKSRSRKNKAAKAIGITSQNPSAMSTFKQVKANPKQVIGQLLGGFNDDDLAEVKPVEQS